MATSQVAATFQNHFEPSPFYVEGSTNLRNQINELCRSYKNVDPPPKKQKAITPKLLRWMFQLAEVGIPLLHDQPFAVITELPAKTQHPPNWDEQNRSGLEASSSETP
jgi:hypothetical protein